MSERTRGGSAARRRIVARALRCAITVAALAVALDVRAQRNFLDFGVGGEILWTDNAAYQLAEFAERDTIVTLTGDVAFRRTAGRLNLTGTAGFSAIEYVRNTQRDRVLPRADITASFEAIDDFFFIDAAVLVTQTATDAFGVRTGPSSTVNKATTSEFRLAPHFKGRFSENVSYLARSENTWSDSSQADTSSTLSSGYTGRHTARLDRAPVPLGAFASVDYSSFDYDNQVDPVLRDHIGRVGLNYAVTPQFSFGIRAGYEKAEGIVQQIDDRFHGVQFEWHPSERTDAAGHFEERFFGNSWLLRFTHRMPRVAWDIASSRDISTFSDLLLTLPQTANLPALLDAAFTTRIPDPNERQRAVRQVLDSTGLPNVLPGPVNVYTERVLIANRTTGTVTLLGARNTLGVSVYYAQYRDLANEVSSIIPPDGTFSTNNRQSGATLAYSLRVSPTTGLTLTGDWNRTTGLDPAVDARSRQKTIRLQVNRQVAPKTTAIAGYRYLDFSSSVDPDSRENAVFVAVSHRF